MDSFQISLLGGAVFLFSCIGLVLAALDFKDGWGAWSNAESDAHISTRQVTAYVGAFAGSSQSRV